MHIYETRITADFPDEPKFTLCDRIGFSDTFTPKNNMEELNAFRSETS